MKNGFVFLNTIPSEDMQGDTLNKSNRQKVVIKRQLLITRLYARLKLSIEKDLIQYDLHFICMRTLISFS